MSINKTKRKRRSEKGSITLFVLMAILFFIIFAFSMFSREKNNVSSQAKQIQKIQSEYNVSNQEMAEKYEEVIGSDKETITKPKITLSQNENGWTNQDVTVVIRFSATLTENRKIECTGTEGVDYEINEDGSIVVKTNNQTITVEASDSDGYKVTEKLKINNIDKTLPTVSLKPNGGSYVIPAGGKTTIKTTVTASDGNGSGLNTLEYAWSTDDKTDPTIWTKFTSGDEITKADCTDGIYYLWTKVTDKVGNEATEGKVSNAYIVTEATEGYEITLKPSEEEWTNKDVTVEITYGENLTGDKKVTCTGEEGKDYEIDENGNVIVKTNNQTITVEATDASGNKVTQEIVIDNIDKTLPTVTLNPNGGTNVIPVGSTTTDISIKLTAKDEGGSDLNKLEYAWSTSNTEEPKDGWKEFTNDGTIKEAIQGGTHYLWTRVTDAAGNRAETGKVSNVFTLNYQVKYDANEGTGAPEETVKVHDTDLTLSDKVPTREGYTFAGWATSKTATTAEYQAKGKYTGNNSVTLYAVWTVNTHKVTYNYAENGGTKASKTEATVNDNTAIDLSITAEKAGYTFVGWNTDKDATTGLESLTMGTNDVTLFAIYSKTVTAKAYYYNNQTTEVKGTIYNKTTEIELTLPEIANQKVNEVTYTARGWATTDGADANIAVASKGKVTLSADATYYASYETEITVTYDANGGTGAPSAQTGTVYMNYTGTKKGISVTIPDTELSRVGYEFNGWNSSADGKGTKYTAGTSYTITDNLIIYAQYTAILFRDYGEIDIQFLSGEGNQISNVANEPVLGSMTPVNFNASTNKWEEVTEENWKYSYNNKAGTSEWANAVVKDASGNITGYFVWIPRYAYKITYYGEADHKNVIGYSDSRGFIHVDGTEIISTTNRRKAGDNYIVHPSFIKDVEVGGWSKELKGIWVAKYEASGNTSTGVQVLPATQSWNHLLVGNMYTQSENYNKSLNSHLMKNSEWGAVSYLTYSNYGLGWENEIEVNTNSSYYTGGATTEKEIYTTNAGQSTTGNAYGIYDMSGGSYDYTAAYVNNGNSYLETNGSSFAISDKTKAKSTEKVTVYKASNSETNSTSDSQKTNYELSGEMMYGDAVYETSMLHTGNPGAWQSDGSNMPYGGTSFFFRSGIHNYASKAGIFYFSYVTGGGSEKGCFRPVLCPNELYTITLDGQEATTAGTGAIYESYETGIYLDKEQTKAMTTSANAITKPAREYKVTYNYNYTGSTNSEATATYTFNGYYTAASAGTQMIGANGYITSNFKNTSYSANTTLYAQWTQKSLTLPTPTREGYTFAGWYDAATGGTKIGNGGATYTPVSDKTLYAQWTANTYTVKYNGNGATSGSTADSTHTYNVEQALTTNGFERKYTVTYNHNYTGSTNTSGTATYTFNGWATSAEGEKVYSDKQNVTNLSKENGATVTLFANWTSKSVTLPTPTRTGYTFGGWYTNSTSGTKVEGTTYTPTANITLVAKWTINTYTITYDNNYYSGNLWTDTNIISKYNYSITAPSSKTNIADSSVMNGQIVKFVMNEGTSNGPYYTVTSKLTVGTQYTWSVYVKASSNKTLRIGQEQGGYKTVNITTSWQKITHTFTATETAQKGFVFYVSGSTWTAGDELYVHSLEIMEGTPTHTSTTKTYNTQLGTLPTPTRTGYTFAGWYTAPTGGTQISTTTTVPAANTTYYAQWTANNYTITYDNNHYSNNLWKDTIMLYRYPSWGTTPTSKTNVADTTAMNGKTIKFVMPAGTQGGPYYQPTAALTAGTQYTWSVYVKASSNKTLTIGQEQGGTKSVNVTTSWQKVTHTFTATAYTTYKAFDFYLNGSTWTAGDELYIHSLEIMQGTPSHTNVSKTYGTTLGTLSTPTRTGHTFSGWYTAPTGGTQVTSNTAVPAANTTYYAHWTNADTAAPTIGSSAAVGASASTFTVTVSGNTDTGGSGITAYYVSTSSATPTINSTWTVNAASSFKFTANASTTYYAWIIDNAGNISSAKTITTPAINYSVNNTAWYTTLEQAISGCATSGSTIYPLNNYTDRTTATVSGKNITLNTNGKTLTRTVTTTVSSGATLTISGSGTLTTGTATYLITNNGTLNVTHTGTISNTTTYTAAILNTGTVNKTGTGTVSAKQYGIFSTAGTVSISAGTVESTNGDNAVTIESTSNLTMTGGTVKNSGNSGALRIGTESESNVNGTATISGGTISNTVGPGLRQYGTTTIKGGTITGGTSGVSSVEGSTTYISAGTISATTGHGFLNHGQGRITGGTIYAEGANEAISNGSGTNNVGLLWISGGLIYTTSNGTAIENNSNQTWPTANTSGYIHYCSETNTSTKACSVHIDGTAKVEARGSGYALRNSSYNTTGGIHLPGSFTGHIYAANNYALYNASTGSKYIRMNGGNLYAKKGSSYYSTGNVTINSAVKKDTTAP